MNSTSEIPIEVLTHFAPILERVTFPKGVLLQEAGKVCSRLYLVEEGILRAYYYKEDKDITAHFAFSQEAITAPDSFITGRPTRYYLESLEESRAYAVDNFKLEGYLKEHPELESLARRFTQVIYLELLQRLESLMFLSAQERYENLLDRNPQLIRRVSLGHIASYLGISRETLSRIRAKVQ